VIRYGIGFPKSLILLHPFLERASRLTSKTRERDNAETRVRDISIAGEAKSRNDCLVPVFSKHDIRIGKKGRSFRCGSLSERVFQEPDLGRGVSAAFKARGHAVFASMAMRQDHRTGRRVGHASRFITSHKVAGPAPFSPKAAIP
jgi:hypothetical protein